MEKEKRNLTLIVKKRWFDMYTSGKKREDYREIKDYWRKRLMTENGKFKEFDNVIIQNGYGKNAPKLIYKYRYTDIGIGDKDLGSPDKECFIIKMISE